MKILAIAPEPFFTPRGTPFSVYYRSLVMAERGQQIDLLTYGEGNDVTIPNVNIVRIPRLRWLEPVRTGPSLGKALLDAVMVLWTIGRLCRRRYDIVHAHEEAVFWCRWLKPVFRFKLVYDMHSSLPQQLENFQFTRSRILTALFNRFEATSLRRSDAVVTICPHLRDYVAKLNGCGKRQVLIENSIFEPVQLKAHTQERGSLSHNSSCDQDAASGRLPSLPPSPRLLYSGTLEPYQGIDLLLDAFARLVKRRPEASLLIVGGTPDQVEHYRQRAGDLGISGRVSFIGRVTQGRAQWYRNHSDVLLSPRTRGVNTPLKLYEQLASGRPLVATDIAAHTQVLSPDVAFLAEATPSSFAAAMEQALAEPATAKQRANAARTLYDEHYDRGAYERKIDRLLEMVR
jgi:glycosyltransferase involved in cell wall biosynthesis